MENKPTTFGSLFESAGDYMETRLDLLKLQAIDKSSEVASSLVSRISILIMVLFAVLLFNIGLSFWVGELLGKVYWGFLVVAAFYVFLAFMLHFFRETWIKEPLSSMIIKKLLN